MRNPRLLVLCAALLGVACPGDWDEPLGPVHGGHLDAKLIGEWSCKEAEGPAEVRVSIVPFDKDQYVIALNATGEKKEKTTYFRGFTTTVSGHDVMNLKELNDDPSEGGWTYARFHQPQASHLSIDPVRREPLESVPDDLESRRQAIGDLFEAPELWEDGFRCAPLKDDAATK
jgi:hypothetical protein